MISEKRLAAARANGAKSRGPVTAQGKANSSRNSLRHGLRARVLFDDGKFEDQRLALLASYMKEFQPKSEFERTWVEIVALSDWRGARIRRLETEIFNHEIRRQRSAAPSEPPHTLVARAFRALTDHSCALELLNRFESRFSRHYYRALDRLSAMRACPAGFFKNTFIDERTEQLVENTEPARVDPTPGEAIANPAKRPIDPQRQDFMDCRAEKVMRKCASAIQAAIPTFIP